MRTDPSRGGLVKRRRFLLTLGAILGCCRRVFADGVVPRFKATLSDAHKGTLEVDTRLLDSYGKLPANLRQFYLDARAIFEANPQADFSDDAIVEAAREHGLTLMGGPMLGDLRSDGVTLWLRPATEARLTVNIGDRSYPVELSGPGVAARVKIAGLSPSTRYRYEVSENRQTVAGGEFKTAPAETDNGEFRIAFGSCCHKIGVHNSHLFRQILHREPSAMLLLGDIAVDDRNNLINMHRADYQLRDVGSARRSQVAALASAPSSWGRINGCTARR